jgi:hypothetical protein
MSLCSALRVISMTWPVAQFAWHWVGMATSNNNWYFGIGSNTLDPYKQGGYNFALNCTPQNTLNIWIQRK